MFHRMNPCTVLAVSESSFVKNNVHFGLFDDESTGFCGALLNTS